MFHIVVVQLSPIWVQATTSAWSATVAPAS